MKRALVIIDMQNDFITGVLGTQEARDIVDDMAEYIRDFDGDIIATLDTHYTSGYMKSMEGKKLPVPHCIYGTDGRNLNATVFEACKQNPHKFSMLSKTTFGSIILPDRLEDYEEIYMCGVCTDICVVSNALLLKAYNPNKPLYVLSDLCAGVTPEKHLSALDVMESCHIDIIKAFNRERTVKPINPTIQEEKAEEMPIEEFTGASEDNAEAIEVDVDMNIDEGEGYDS